MRSKATYLCVAALTLLTAACGGSRGSKPVIGFLLGTLREDRWVRDRDFFVAEAQSLGADVIAQSANNDDATQLAQAEDLLKRGVDVLVIVPTSAQAALAVVEAAHKKNVPVVAYERMILQSDVDMYVATNALKIGELQAKYLVDRAPRGNYVIIGGAPNDNNSQLLREGQMRVLKPLIDQGAIRIVGDENAADWKPEEALRITETALARTHNDLAAVLAPNDGTASGAIQRARRSGSTRLMARYMRLARWVLRFRRKNTFDCPRVPGRHSRRSTSPAASQSRRTSERSCHRRVR